MRLNFMPDLVSEPNSRETFVRIQGAGAANPTKVFGNGIVVTRVATGQYRIAFSENPYVVIGVGAPMFESTTGSDVKNYSLTSTPFSATGVGGVPYTYDLFVWNSAGAATDLTSVQFLTVRVLFKEGRV